MNAPIPPSRAGSGWWRGRDRLQVAIVINQLATPGLGSWVAGRRIAGAGQLVLALVGFALYVVYFGFVIRNTVEVARTGVPPPSPPDAWWHWALGLFGIAWVWAGVTSTQLALELRRRRSTGAASGPPSLPPRLGPGPD